jgi:hypothetical protein
LGINDSYPKDPKTVKKILDLYQKNHIEVVKKGYENAEETNSGKHNKIFFSLDTQTDELSVDSWLKNKILVDYLEYTGEKAKNRNKNIFVRLIVIFDSIRLKNDIEYKLNIIQTINIHIKLNIIVGLVHFDNIPKGDFSKYTIDFNSLVGNNLHLLSPSTGFIQVIDKKINKYIVTQYKALYYHLDKACKDKKKACYITEYLTEENFFNKVAPLFET